MISEAGEYLIDYKMSLGNFDVMASSEVPEVEADLTNLMRVVDGIEVRIPISRIHVYFFTCLIFDRRD